MHKAQCVKGRGERKMALETKPEIAEQLKPAKLRMSLQEFLEWTDEDVWAEWEDGEVIFLSPASFRTSENCRLSGDTADWLVP
jgi:hypothetical protein